jgi:hypothetical protein
MTEGGRCQEEDYSNLLAVIFILQRAAIGIDGTIPAAAVAEDAREEGVDAQLIAVADRQFVDTVSSKSPTH